MRNVIKHRRASGGESLGGMFRGAENNRRGQGRGSGVELTPVNYPTLYATEAEAEADPKKKVCRFDSAPNT